MVVWLNDAIRAVVRSAVPIAAFAARRRIAAEIARYRRQQDALRTRYAVDDHTPIADYAHTQQHLEAYAAQRNDVVLAETSGSTGAPKRLPYTPDRLRRFRQASRDAGLRAFTHFGISRPELFVFSGLAKDRSFSSLVLHNGKTSPRYFTGLVEPARYLRHPAMAAALQEHGITAARVFLLSLACPGLLYSTNPSTLAVFLGEVRAQWADATALVRGFLDGRHPALGTVVRRVGRRGWRRRFNALANAKAPLPFHAWAPDVRGFCCWDGGYVGPFIAQIRAHLPAHRYIHIPMYAMSTETVETLPVAHTDGLAFLPISPDVLYEFLPASDPDTSDRLIRPDQVAIGQEVCMVVTDPYGLRRYQTEDVFECVGHLGGIPDLRFRRRRGLTWSFTGEKLTGIQLSRGYADLREMHPTLAGVALSCVPTQPATGLPGYVLLVANAAVPGTLAVDFDTTLSALNGEYRTKRGDGRLAAPRVCGRPYASIAATLGGAHWESQFKLAPLTRRLFESLADDLG